MEKNKQTLAFEQLEAEMELITREQLLELKGGGGVFDGPMDCIFQAVAFATGRPLADIQNEYVGFYNNYVSSSGWSSTWNISFDQAGVMGVPYDLAPNFFSDYNLASGYTSPVGNGQSGMGGAGVILVPGHAYNITGMHDPWTYSTFDAQSGQTSTIAKDDPSIIGVYGFH